MDIANVVTRVQRQFGDESGVQVVETDVLRWINDAQNEATTQIPFLLKETTTFASVANQQIYSLPANLADIEVMKYQASGMNSFYNLRGVASKQLNEYIDTWEGTDFPGDPLYYARGKNQNIRVFPVPDNALGLFKLDYGRYATDVVTSASTIDLPLYLHPYVVEFCLMKAYEMDEEWEAADRKAQYVQSTLDANAFRDNVVSKETYPSVIPTASDYL